LGTGSDLISAFVRRHISLALVVKCGVTLGVTVATLQPAIVSETAAASGVRSARLSG
jgi:hypothetical protein